MKISLFSEDKRIVRLADHIRRKYGRDCGYDGASPPRDICLLPIPSVRDGVHITGTDISIDDAITGSAEGTVFVGYGIPYSAVSLINERGGLAFDCEDDGIFVDKNARLTAEGAIGRIMTDGAVALSDMHIGVIGLGRIGSYLCRMLCAIGSAVTAFSSKAVSELYGARVLPYSATEDFDFSALSVLINTAPADVLACARRDTLSAVRVIELASGENIPAEIKYERFAAVPSKMYIESASAAYVDFYERCAAKYDL